MTVLRKVVDYLRALRHLGLLWNRVEGIDRRLSCVEQNHARTLAAAEERLSSLESGLHDANRHLESMREMRDMMPDVVTQGMTTEKRIELIEQRLHELDSLIDSIGRPEPQSQDRFSSFYSRFEDQFRGPKDEIKNRLRFYLPHLEAVALHFGGPLRVLDLGCGRGEWLELVKEAGHIGFGVDGNVGQILRAREAHVDVVHDDIIDFVRKQPRASWHVVSAIHVVEHLPFSVLVDFLREILRVLHPGGLLILETPNPHNLIVGAFSFHLDPTHNKPLPPELLSMLVEAVGFVGRKVMPIHPDDRLNDWVSRGSDPELAALLLGPRDYALIANCID